MGREAGHRSQGRQGLGALRSRLSLARVIVSQLLSRRRRLCVALVGGGLLIGGALAPNRAEALAACANGNTGEIGIIDAACCPSDVLAAYWPGRSPQLNQTFCQLLVFPTSTRANADDFNQRLVNESLSSDSRRASAEIMTLPSLWWNRDSLTPRLGGRRLVQSWISYQIKDSATPVVDVVINPQMWSVLTYNERFAVLNQFGTAARDFGYNLRFFQGNARSYRMVGLYACDFSAQPGVSESTSAAVNTCSANLDAGQIVQIQRNLVAEGDRRQQLSTPTAQTPSAEGSL